MKNTPIAFLAASLIAADLHGQSALFESSAAGGEYQHGFAVARGGDVDGDGLEDYWIGSPEIFETERGGGFVSRCSGANGSAALTLEGTAAGEHFGYSLAGGWDLSGDGVSDILVGAMAAQWAPEVAGSVHLFSGADGSLLHSVAGPAPQQGFAEALAILDDLDGDGVRDFAVGEPRADVAGTDSGRVRVYSGASGGYLGALPGPSAGALFGSALANAGDVDLDGREDLWIGAPGGAGQARLVSAGTGATLRTLGGALAGDRFGHAIARADDLDGDSVPDVVIGAPGARRASAHAGAGGALLWSVTRTRFEPLDPGYPGGPADFGWAVCAIGDQDGDGRSDVAVGYPDYSGVWFFSGADGDELGLATSAYVAPVSAESLPNRFGWSFAALSDLDGDGREELAIGAPMDDPSNSYPDVRWTGSVAVVAPAPARDRVRHGDGTLTGGAVARAGDVDGDGAQDFAYTSQGGIRLVSGRTRALLRTYPGPFGGHPQLLACAGDLDLDGVEDLVVAGNPVKAFSGLTGADLARFESEAAGNVAGLGDLDGDGVGDVALAISGGHPGGATCWPDFPGLVRVVSGASGALLFQLDGGVFDADCGPVGENLGYSVSSAGDWNRDGTADVAVGAPGGGELHTGAARVFSGVDGALLREFVGSVSFGEFGISVSGGPGFDVDADGYVDLVVGEQVVGYGPHPSTGSARVFSSRDGSVLGGTSWFVPLGYGRETGPGYSVAALADFDLDGHSDYAASNPAALSPLGPGAGEVIVRSGRTGSILRKLSGTSSWDYLGYSLASLGDADGDGATDLLVGAPTGQGVPSSFTNTPYGSGSVFFVRRPLPKAQRGGTPGSSVTVSTPR